MGIGIKLKTRLSRLLSNIRGYNNSDKDISSEDDNIVSNDNRDKSNNNPHIAYDNCINLDIRTDTNKETRYEGIKLLYVALYKMNTYMDNAFSPQRQYDGTYCSIDYRRYLDRVIQYIPCIDTLVFRYIVVSHFNYMTNKYEEEEGYLFNINGDHDIGRSVYTLYRICLRRVKSNNKSYCEYKILLKSERNNDVVVEKTINVNSKLWFLANDIFDKANKNGFMFKGYMNDFLYAVSYYRNKDIGINGYDRPIQGFEGIKLYNYSSRFGSIEIIPSKVTKSILYNWYYVDDTKDSIARV